MRRNWTPSIVPNGDDQNVYLVLDDFAQLGRSYRETDPGRADLETTISDLRTVNLTVRFESSPSTPPNVGRGCLGRYRA
jgi:hypothetical protein